MLEKREYVRQTDEGRALWEKKYGGYNDPPPRFKEATEQEIAVSALGVYSWEYQQYRQISPDNLPGWNEKYYLAVRLFFMDDGNGFGMHFDYHGKRIRWFTFTACEHKMEAHGPQGMHLSTSKCTECGWVRTIDSSG